MAETVLLASKALFAVAGCGAGVRLAQLARRSGGVPLHAWASAIIFVGGLGLFAFGLGPSLAVHSESLAHWVMLAGDGLERLSLLALAVFVWSVFGEGRRGRMLALGLLLVLMSANWTLVLVTQRWPQGMLSKEIEIGSQLCFSMPFVWATFEAVIARRRERAPDDPNAAQRHLLWALASGGFALICFVTAFVLWLPDRSAFAPWLDLFRALLYTAIAAIVMLAFFPPDAYERRLHS